jgi:hypothetical protein
MAQLCRSSLPRSLVSAVERLYTSEIVLPNTVRPNDIESHWLELLHSFTTVKDLYLSRQVLPHIAPALQEELGERAADVLPALRNLFIEEIRSVFVQGKLPSKPIQKRIQQFVNARQRASHPVDVSHCDGNRIRVKWD